MCSGLVGDECPEPDSRTNVSTTPTAAIAIVLTVNVAGRTLESRRRASGGSGNSIGSTSTGGLSGGPSRKTTNAIGAPDAARLHKAAKASPRVAVYTHKDPANLVKQLQGERITLANQVRALKGADKPLDLHEYFADDINTVKKV